MSRRILLLAVCLLTALSITVPAQAAAPLPSIDWVGTNPYGFYMGDSLTEQCHSDFGMDWRSLGYVAWPGVDAATMRARMDSNSEDWPYITESSHAEELTWFHDAGWLVFGLVTNSVKTETSAQFADDVDWFMERANGRPTLWFDGHNPPFAAQTAAFNRVLAAKAQQWPNLLVLPWDAWADQHPDALLPDQVHVATYEYGCQQGRNKLIQMGAPAVDREHAQAVGYWYPDPSTDGEVHLNGWGANRLPADGPVQINVRSDYGHVGRWPVDNPTDDVYAQAAAGRGFGLTLGPEFRGHLICLDLLDAAGQWTSLDCRTA